MTNGTAEHREDSSVNQRRRGRGKTFLLWLVILTLIAAEGWLARELFLVLRGDVHPAAVTTQPDADEAVPLSGEGRPSETPTPAEPAEPFEIKPVFAAASVDHSAWIRDGHVYLAGEPFEGQDGIGNWRDAVQVAVSDHHILALDSSGTVHAAGSNASLQCEIDGVGGVVHIAAGMNCSLAVMSDGTVQVFGVLDDTIREDLKQETDAAAVALGEHHAVVLHGDGTVTACGENAAGECEVSGWNDIVSVAAGTSFTVGLTRGGAVLYSGDNSYSQGAAAEWTGVRFVAAGSGFVVGIMGDGTVRATGRNSQGECETREWSDVVSVAAGYDHTIGVCGDGSVLAAGYNGNGQCDVEAI